MSREPIHRLDGGVIKSLRLTTRQSIILKDLSIFLPEPEGDYIGVKIYMLSPEQLEALADDIGRAIKHEPNGLILASLHWMLQEVARTYQE